MHMLLLFFCSSATTDASQPVAAPVEPPSPFVDIGPVDPSLQLSDELADALRDEEHALAAQLLGDLPEGPERDLLLAWSLVHADRPEEAARFTELQGPDDVVALVEGRAHLSRNRLEEAEQALGRVGDQSPLYREALAFRAEALTRLGDPGARGLLEELVSVADPAHGSGEALLQLAAMDPDGPWAERLQAFYPALDGPDAELDWVGKTHRAERFMEAGDWDGALAVLATATPTGDGVDACRYAYVKGRSLYKKSDKPGAEAALKAPCTDSEYGPKVSYLRARNAYRRGHHKTAASVYVTMADTWPEHSYADDGLVLGGRAKLKSGDRAGAQALWRRALDEFPEGDMSAEGAFELGWTLYLDGKGAEAEEVMTALGALDVSIDPLHVTGGRYWSGRLALYPNVGSPTTAVPEGKERAVERWAELVVDQPWSYYAVMAQARLLDEAPERARTDREVFSPPSTWTVRRELAEGTAPELLSLGLVDLASRYLPEDLETDEQAWWFASRMDNGDSLQAHREIRRWVPTSPSPSADAMQLLSLAYPDYWLDEVTLAAEGDRYPVRYFHGLVRVESDFDPYAVSWAGARGLCQVMPATGKNVGVWMGMTVTKDDLLDPETNLKVGARYMDELHMLFDSNPALAAAGYNAGEHRVKQWIDAWGNIPTDEYVERIPFDETRGYAKKVVGTWQTYHWLRGEGAPIVDLSAFNDKALPSK
jgi:soluble lytic murein transglycosylase